MGVWIMSSATLSILGLYQWGMAENNDIFENLILPDGINKELVTNTILEQCAEFEILYPDFDYMKFSIGLWSQRWYRTFDKWNKDLQIEYNPIHNYDRTEEWTEKDNGSASSIDSASSVSDNYVTAYNSDNLRKESQNKASSSGKQIAETENENVKKGRAYGNIGVTTTVAMLSEDMEFARFNLIQQIVDCFKTEFCILVY